MKNKFTIVSLFIIMVTFIAVVRANGLAPDGGTLTAPTNISCQGYEEDAVVVRWQDNADDETNYRVERRIGGGSWTEVATMSPNGSGNYDAYKETGIDTSQQNRFYRVRAYRLSDGAFSSYSPVCNNRRLYESANFRFFYGLRGTSDACPTINGQEVCLENVNNGGGTNAHIALSDGALQGSVDAFSRVGFGLDAGSHNTLDKIPINVVWCDGGGCAGGGGLGLSPLLMETDFDVNTRVGDPVAWIVAEHEAFHFQQFKYGGLSDPAGKWVVEGQARSTQDKICIGDNRSDCEHFDDIDTGYAGYVPEINAYLGNPNRPINQTSYQAALFWTYLTEKYGLYDPSDPVEGGMDLMVEFWEESAATPGRDGITVLNSALANMGHSETFRDIWKDFAVANYAKNLTSGVPSRYQYEDMAQPGGTYNLVKLTIDQNVNLGDQIVDTDETVQPWGAQYYQIKPAADVPIIDINFTQDSPHKLYYTVLGIQGNELAYEYNVESRHLAHTLINDSYDKVVVVVAGLENLANYRYSFNGTQPELRIITPTTANKARVGNPASPDKFLARVEIIAPDGTPLAGVNLSNFSFRVGTVDVPAGNILTSATVQNQQWFVLRAPVQMSTGQYNFQVDYSEGVLSDTENAAVDYTPRNDADSVLIIDRSGSMGDFNKLSSAQAAARLFVDSWRSGDQIGVVSFNSLPTVDLGLTPWTDSPSGGSRQDAFDEINALTAGGGTAIGDALRSGWDELDDHGNNSHDWALILLSDGMETGTPTETFDDLLDALTSTTGKRPVVHTVAVGPDADRPRMQSAANRTGGTYQFVSLPAPLNASPDSAGINDLQLDMDARYRMIATEIIGQQQFFSFVGPDNDGDPYQDEITINVEGSVAELVLTLSWNPSIFGTITLQNPNSTYVSAFHSDSRHKVWRIPTPMPGAWTLTIPAYDPPGLGGEDRPETEGELLPPYLIQASVRSDVTMDLYMTTDVEERTPGTPMGIIVSLTDTGPISGALVWAVVTSPSGTEYTILLYDDGEHGDGEAGDGIYGNTFYQTGLPGSYNVKATAWGTSPLSGTFWREKLASFHIDSEGDDDGDGLPNEWEIRYHTNPNVPDANEDPDNDGSTNGNEHQEGTDPHDPDTDDGGESDGTDADPHDPSDDGITPTWGVAYPGDAEVFVRYADYPEYTATAFLRGSSPDGTFALLPGIHPPTGYFTDTTVINGTLYCYRVLATDGTNVTAPSAPTCATPNTDPYPPHGSILINDGAPSTPSPYVTLTLWATDSPDPEGDIFEQEPLPTADSASGVTEMMLSNQADMSDGVWEPYDTSKAWTLDRTQGLAAVYVKYRDAEGNESDVVPASIHVGTGPGLQAIYLPFVTTD